MQEIFYGLDYQDESLVSNKSNKQFKSKDLELQHLVKSIENIETEYQPFNSNISKHEQEALQKLIANKDIIIKSTDKGAGLVLMDKTYYRDHLVNKEHLYSTVCKEVPLDSDKKVYKLLLLLVKKYKSNLTSKEIKYLTDFKWQSSNVYFTPKLHKCKSIQQATVLANDDYIEIHQPDDLKERSIISGPKSPTQRLSCIIETLRKPKVPHLITYIKDDWEFIQFLHRSLTFDSNMYSCDIESLYISIRTELVLEAIEYWIMRKRGLIPQRFTKEYILESIEFILKNKNFSFDSEMFNQIIGTAMRTKCAPPYACLTIGYQEETKLSTQELIKIFFQMKSVY